MRAAIRPRATSRGMTLIELIAVLSIFALLAVMGLQSISTMMRAQERLAATDAESAALSRTLTLMRADLSALVPMRFHPPDGDAEPALLAGPGAGGIRLSVGGQPTLPGEKLTGLARVVWRLDPRNNRLTRQVWPTLVPSDARARAPEVTMLEGVGALDLRAYLSEAGWTDGYGTASDRSPTALPEAIEIRLDTGRFGSLRLVVAL